jgi:hypothetical protein
MGVKIGDQSVEVLINRSSTDALTATRDICRHAGIDAEEAGGRGESASVCGPESELFHWVRDAMRRRDYELRARDVALALACEVECGCGAGAICLSVYLCVCVCFALLLTCLQMHGPTGLPLF